MPKSLSNKEREDESPLLFYDGHCALCNGAVNRLIKADKHQRFSFAPLQGTTAEKAFQNYPELRDIDSLILFVNGKIYTRSDAAIRSATLLGGAWRLAGCFYIFPKFFRDWVYDGVARVRYKWFGKYDACPLPPVEWRSRFLP